MAEKVKAFRLKIAQRMVELKKQPLEMLVFGSDVAQLLLVQFAVATAF